MSVVDACRQFLLFRSLKAETAELRKKSGEQQSEKEVLEATCAKLGGQHSEQELKIKALTEERAELSREIEERKAHLEELDTWLAAQELKNKDLVAHNAKLKEELATMKEELAEAERTTADKTRRLAFLEETCSNEDVEMELLKRNATN